MKKTFIAIAITLMPFKLVSDDIWVGLFAKKVPYTAETFVYGENLSEFNNAIDREWNNGFDIVDIEYGDGKWSAIMAKGTGYKQAGLST